MKILGIWPEERKYNQASSYLILLPLSMMLLFIGIPQTIDLYFIWGDIDLTTENLSVGNMTVLLAIIKATIFWFSGESISVLLSNMEEDRKEANTEEETRRMMSIAKISRKISIACTLTYDVLVILFVILHFLLVHYIGRILIMRSYFPYNIQSTPNYELTVFAQTLAACCMGNAYTSVDTFLAMLVLHVCGQFENLGNQLRDLRRGNDNEFYIKLVKIVKKHDSLNRYTLVPKEEKKTLFFVYNSFAQKISIKVADAAYECKWYDLSPNEAKSLMIIMHRARVPLCITAGKFSIFSHQLFTDILKTSMGYLSVLLAVNVVNTE
ncbi:uncharacterized protein LOC124422862 [Vespa crabro]|uniref:uncharacterized protein LOC124422862 n=1 Tax=Vespa crabro TaxID=7445 RepID=UPI001F023B33|nr:uncharacterized protein LOC124422862 [Vespa crabro]